MVDDADAARHGAAVSGQGDPDVPVRVIGDQGRVLQAQSWAELLDRLAGPAVEYPCAIEGGDDHVVVAGAVEVGGHHRTDDLGGDTGVPEGPAGGRVENPDRARTAQVGPFDHLERPIAKHARQCRGREQRAAAEVGRPLQPAVGVVGLDRAGVRGAGEVRPRCHHDARGAPGEESSDRRGGVDHLVGVGPTDLVAIAAEDAKVAPVGVGLALAGAGGLVPTDGDLGLAGAVEVGHCCGGVGAVGVEEGPTGQRVPALGGQCVAHLAKRPGNQVRSTGLEIAHREAGLDAGCRRGVGGRIDRRGEPETRPGGAVCLIPAGGRVGVVPRADEHDRLTAQGGGRRGGIDGAALVGDALLPPGDRRRRRRRPRRSGQVEGVEMAEAIPHHHGRLAVEIGRDR